MSTEVLAFGTRCNLNCGTPTATYCYQDAIRRSENEGDPRYDKSAIKKTLLERGQRFSMFGGEPLLMHMRELEDFFKFGMENFKGKPGTGSSVNAIQSNGTLMTEEHIQLFRKYDVGVGISVDGPVELNDARWAGSTEATRAATAKTQWALSRLLELKHPVSIIVTAHQLNAKGDRLPKLLDWFRALRAQGLSFINIHLLESDNASVEQELGLTVYENVELLLACNKLMKEIGLHFAPLTDMKELLRGRDRWNESNGSYWGGVTCTWNGCDPYTTAAVQGIDGKGRLGNCGRTCQDGPYWVKANKPGYERYIALGNTPMQYGGCKECRFFVMCKGHCPGEGEGFDWRGKTSHCLTLMRVFEALEQELFDAGEIPLSANSVALGKVKQAFLSTWGAGRNTSIVEIMAGKHVNGEQKHTDVPHRDHTDVANPVHTYNDHTDVGGTR